MRLPRRSFLRKAAVAAVGFTIIPRHVLGRGFVPPSETLNHVIVGCGGISGSGAHFGDHMKGAHRVLAVCDVDDNHARNRVNQVKAAGGNTPLSTRDFREVIGLADADVVHVCTPPHWHGVIAAQAARAGKAVWCEIGRASCRERVSSPV